MAYGTVELNPGTGGNTVASDAIAGAEFQRVKLSLGAEGAAVDAVAGAGSVSTGVQRVTLASDDPAVAALQILDNCISGNEAQVDIVAALPAGANAIGTVTAVGAAAEDAAASGNPVLVGGRYDSSARTLETGDVGAIAVNASGHAMVQVASGGIAGIVDDAAFTPATSEVLPVGYFADDASTDSVDEGDIGAARMTLDRKQIVNIQPHTTGGCTIFKSIDIDESEEEVKATAGVLYSITAMNMVATARYLKFYNLTAANTTVGTSTPVMTIPIPANSTTGAGITINNPLGWTFDTAISVACTTGVADADTGAPGANDVIILLGYK